MDINKVIIIVLLLVAVVGYIRLYRHYRRNIKKVTFLFDAIDNGDFSFNFPTEKGFKEDKILHKSLNRIKLFLQHTREEQMDREKYYEQILNAVDTGILVVDSHDNILQHNQAALRLLDTDVLTHMNQVKGKLKDEHLAKHETQAMLKDKHVRIIALSDVSHELSNQEVDSWIKLIRVLTHEIMNTITPVTSLSETLLKEMGSREQLATSRDSEDSHSPNNISVESQSAEQAKLKQGLETIHKTGTELLAFVNNYRRFTHVPQPQPALFYVEPFLERMAMLCNHEVEISVSPKDLLAYADESLLSHVVTNLLKNAVEAFKEKEREDKQECRSANLQSAASKKAFIRLQAYANAQESIIIDVSNNAGLIPDEVASHIFIPFFTTKPEGSGIGLSLSRQIMRVSGGSLSLLQDKAQGITTFRIIIP
jgi:nitrogen fixation/metabolism regulation signal transduction histidine kinase